MAIAAQLVASRKHSRLRFLIRAPSLSFLLELHLQTMTAVNENNPERFSAAEIRSMLVALEADNKVMVRDDTITLIAS